MTVEEKIRKLEEMMDLEENELTLDSVLDDIEEWDSLSAWSLVVFVKTELGKQLTSDVLNRFKTVRDICDYLE